VHIEAAPERIWNWLDGLPRHYREWHPSHLDCRYIRGNHLTEGAVLHVHERLHGKLHSLTLRADVVVPDRLLRYSGRGVRGAFILEPAGHGTRFTAQLEVGAPLPLIGRLVDPVLRRLMAKRLSEVQEHMREEGRNLKHLLEGQERHQDDSPSGPSDLVLCRTSRLRTSRSLCSSASFHG
jgi:hypothetical protein